MKKELLCIYNDLDNDDEKDFLLDWAENKRELLEEDKKEALENAKDCKLGTSLWKQYDDEVTKIENEIKLSDSDLKDMYEESLYEYMSMCQSDSWEYFQKEANENWKPGLYVLDGSAGLWNGPSNVNDILEFTDFDDFLNNMRDVDYVKAEYYSDGTLNWIHAHHDGRNSYDLKLVKNCTKSEIREWIEENDASQVGWTDKQNLESIREDAKQRFNKSYSKLNKEELVEFLEYLRS